MSGETPEVGKVDVEVQTINNKDLRTVVIFSGVHTVEVGMIADSVPDFLLAVDMVRKEEVPKECVYVNGDFIDVTHFTPNKGGLSEIYIDAVDISTIMVNPYKPIKNTKPGNPTSKKPTVPKAGI